jgi:large subunit ribosomal protein L15
MMIHEITTLAGKFKARKRVGRGTGSGTGRRSGRGQKGASSRSGHASKLAFEGGQMPYFRRLRKFGFSNVNFTTHFWIVNLRSILSHPAFAKGGEVSMATLQKAGLVRDDSRDLKILGDLSANEKVGVKLTVTANRVSAKAKEMITGAGGSVTETGTRRDKVRGIDRMSEDKTPKNLTKKLKRSSGPKKVVIEDLDADAKDAKDAKKGKGEAKPAKDAGAKDAAAKDAPAKDAAPKAAKEAPKAPAKDAPKAE